VIDTFLDGMKQGLKSAQLAQAEYRQINTIRVRRLAPLLSSRGKHHPLRTLQGQQNQSNTN
jgi:hypothetical protein